ncbi:MAG: hypothetical protein AAGN82_21075, partial [Myxococcota bacterium]
LERACALGDPGGCHHLGLFIAVEDDAPETAIASFRQGCRWGSGAACTEVGILLRRGEGVRLDRMAATSAFVQSCRQGDAVGCGELGWLRLTGEGKRDVLAAVRDLTGACRAGAADACARLGLAQLRGAHGLERDRAAGEAMLAEACTRGSPRGCLALHETKEGGALPRIVEAAPIARSRCREAQGRCASAAEWTATWRVSTAGVTRAVRPPPRCGGELERVCHDAREVSAAHCDADPGACWAAATFGRTLVALGAGATTAADQEARAVAWARGACPRGDARGCAVLAAAHRQGRGGLRQDDRAADAFLARACRADAGYCP